MSSYEVLDLSESQKWNYLLKQLPLNQQDIYYTPEYYKVYENYGDGKAFCFVYFLNKDFAIYPFLLSRINDLGYELDESYYDIEGAYGYNGAAASSYDSGFIKNFYGAFNRFCKENNIIAEFTRFNPLLGNHKFSDNFLDVSYNRQTVYIDLTQSYDAVCKNYSAEIRKNLLIANKNKLSFSAYKNEFPFKEEFIQMYKENMNRVNAESYFLFNDLYFDNIFSDLSLIQFVVTSDKTLIASVICLFHNSYMHTYLSASNIEYLKFKPNNLLFDGIIKFCYENGYKIFHFGGGRSISEDDSLLKFKKNFSKLTADFYVGKQVHNEKIYSEVIRQWEMKNSKHSEISHNILLRYKNTGANL